MQASGVASRLKEFWGKAKTIKNLEVIIAVIVIGVVLLIYASAISTDKTKKGGIGAETSTFAEGEELRLAEILSQIEGAGKVSVMITYEQKDEGIEVATEKKVSKIKGVIIVAEGAKDVGVRLNLIRATQTVLNVKSNTIEVFVMKNK